MGFRTTTRPVVPGEQVAAHVTNRTALDAFNNTQYLNDQLELASTGTALFIRNASVISTAVVGSAVYLNHDTGVFELAIAKVTIDGSGQATMDPSSNVWGVVYTKHSDEVADLLIGGYAALDVSAAVVGDVTVGDYFLSTVTAGKITATKPSIAVPVLRRTATAQVLFFPQWRDVLEDHIHYRFELTCLPAGEHVDPTETPHEITSPDVDLPGWLPADHASFSGNAPAGAKFGYNMAMDPALNSVWPPVPLNGALLVLFRGNTPIALIDPDTETEVGAARLAPYRGGTEVALGSCGHAIIDEHGIWWMTDCYRDVPWPYDLDTTVSESDSESEEDCEVCPQPADVRLTLYFIKPVVASSKTIVTSLRPAEGSRLSVTCYPDGPDEVVGDLQISLDLDFVSEGTDTEGHIVLKNFDDETFNRGPVVEGIFAGSDRVLLTSTAQLAVDDATLHQGRITIDVDTEPGGRELDLQLIRLQGATQEFPFDIHAIGFKAGQTSLFRAKLHVPLYGAPTDPQLYLRFRIMGRSAGTLPTLELAYRRIPASETAVAIPTSDTPLAFVSAVAVGANEYLDLESSAFAVVAGDVVIVELKRVPDAYAGEVDILQMVGVLETAP